MAEPSISRRPLHPSCHGTTELLVIVARHAGRHDSSDAFRLLHVLRQAWSITYHSLLTLVFLLWACLIWVLPNSRKWCLLMSPFYTIYAGILLTLQYACGFKISFEQANLPYDRRTMDQIGIRINDYNSAFVPLVVKVRTRKTMLRLNEHHLDVFLVVLHDLLLVNSSTIHERTRKCQCATRRRFVRSHFLSTKERS